MKLRIFYFLLSVLMLSSCSKDQLEVDQSIIESYLTEHNLEAEAHPSGLYYVLKKEGMGERYPDVNSEVTIEYKGYLTDNTVFDEANAGDEITVYMGDLVEGLQESIALLKEGGTGIFLMPSELGYSHTVRAGIPSHSVLIFEIKLVDIE